jgi:hypothetical protein
VETRSQALPLFTAACVLIGVLVVVQLWLLAASLESMLAGDAAPAVPATIASAAILATNAGLLRGVVALDRRVRHLR